MEIHAQVVQVIQAFEKIPVFDSQASTNRLFNKVRNCGNIEFLKAQLPGDLGNGPDPDSSFIDSVDAGPMLTRFAEQAAGTALKNLPAASDKYNFKNCISQVRIRNGMARVALIAYLGADCC